MKRLLTILVLLPMLMRAQTLVKPILTEYRAGFLYNDGSFRTFNNGSPGVVSFPQQGGATSWVGGAGGFNAFLLIDNLGKIWKNKNDNTTNFTAISTDSTGASITDAWGIDATNDTYGFLRADSSVWYGGNDSFRLVHSSGAVDIRPIKISGSIKFKKIVLSGVFRIIGLASNGDVYEWLRNSGSIIPTQKTIPRPAIDIWGCHYDYAGCLIPNATGSQTMGYAYVWGSQFGAWQGNAPYTQPTNIMSQWGVAGPLKQVCANWNATHLIDSLGRMYANAYSQANGELGNGFDPQYQYSYSAPYSSTLNDGENPSGATMIQISPGIKWKALYSNTFFTFYKYAVDSSDNLYHCGSGKARVAGDGNLNLQEATYRNPLDNPTFTLVTPLTAVGKTLNFQLPNIGAGTNQSITLSSTTVTATGHPALLINAANSTDTIRFTVASWLWTKVSGPAATITSPNSKSTTITGLSNGSYVFQDLMTDNYGGTDTGKVQIVVTLSTTPPNVNAGTDQIITLPTSSTTLTGTASGNGGTTIASTAWTRISGPNTPTIVSPSTLSTSVTGLIAGVYVFQLSATDSNGNTANDQVQVTVNTGTSCNCAGPSKVRIVGH